MVVDIFNSDQRLWSQIVSSLSFEHGSSAKIYEGIMYHHNGYTQAVALKVFPSILSHDKQEVCAHVSHQTYHIAY